MSIWQKEKENQIDTVTQLENELEAEEEISAVVSEETFDDADQKVTDVNSDNSLDEISEDISEDVLNDISEDIPEDSSEEVSEEKSTKDSEKPFAEVAKGMLRTIPRWAYGLLIAAVGIALIFFAVSRISFPTDTVEESEPALALAMVSADYSPEPPLTLNSERIASPVSYEKMVDNMRGWVNEFGRINLREEASFDAKVVGYVVYGDRLKTFEQEGEFTRVKYFSPINGEMTEGYCYTEYISDTEPDNAQVYLNVPLYKQADYRWGAVKIGSYETLASAGCTTTCISMVESYMTGKEVHPDDVVKTLYYTYDGRLVFPDYYTHHWARDYMTVAVKKLHEGVPVLVSGYNSAGGTHWVVLVAYKGDGEDFSSDLFLINDPGSPRYTLTDFMRDYPFIEKIVYYNK